MTTLFSVQIIINGSINSTMYVHWVKLEEGKYATDFSTPIYSAELAKCQRYYIRYSGNGNFVADGFSSTDAIAIMSTWFPVSMRQTPTIKGSGLYLSSSNHIANNSKSCTLTGSNISFNTNVVKFEVSSTGLTKGETNKIQIRTSGGYLEFDARL